MKAYHFDLSRSSLFVFNFLSLSKRQPQTHLFRPKDHLPARSMLKLASRNISIPRALLARKFSTQGHIFSLHCSRKLEGKVALITGAATGLGKETARKFIENGAKVVIADINYSCGQATETELKPNAAFFPCNVANESDISSAVNFAVSKFGGLDIMYNNAGIACRSPRSICDIDLDVFDRVMATNVRGIVAGIKHASRVMIPRGAGSIICTASVTGMMGGLAQHTYSISKASVIGIVKSVAGELSRHGIRVNCISPFAVATSLVMDEMKDIYPGVDEEKLTNIINNVGVLRGAYCEPSDVANAAVYLASDEAKYVSGHNLVLDGGFTSVKTLDFPAADKMQ